MLVVLIWMTKAALVLNDLIKYKLAPKDGNEKRKIHKENTHTHTNALTWHLQSLQLFHGLHDLHN